MEMLAALQHSAFATWVREANTVWAYPTVLTLHTVGLAVLVGANAAVDLRFLGFGRQIAVAEMERFFPAMWVGFWLNAITGAMLFTVDATTKGVATVFMIKLGLVVAGVTLMVLLRRAQYGPVNDRAIVAPAAKTYAALSLFVWVGAIATGRLMAYL